MKEVYSDSWLKQRDINIDLHNEYNTDNLNVYTLLKILNSVKQIVNIVHGNNQYDIIFDNKESSGYINYGNKTIVISAKLLKDPTNNYNLYDIVDILTGIALHESGHAEYSEKNTNKLNELNTKIKHHIYNIIEDVVIEKLISNNFPGYEVYFLKLRKHYFKNASVTQTNNATMDKLNELLIGLRYVGETELKHQVVIDCINKINDIINLPNDKLMKIDRIQLTNEIFTLLFKSTNNITNDNNVNNFKNISKTISSHNNNNGSNNSDNSDNSDNNSNTSNPIKEDLENNEEKEEENDIIEITENTEETEDVEENDIIEITEETENIEETEDIEDDELDGALKDFIEEQKKEQESTLNDLEKAQLSSLEDEEYDELINETKNSKRFYVDTCKPKTTDNDKLQYKKMHQNIKKQIITFRNKFAFANTPYNVNVYNLQTGQLDDDNLYSAKYNRNLFMNNTISTKSRTQDIDIAFVMDFSGSMSLYLDYPKKRYHAAQELAILFSEALAPIKSINSWVLAFQTLESYNSYRNNIQWNSLSREEAIRTVSATQLINLYSPTNKNKYSITSIEPDGYTPEYEALYGTINMLKKHGKKTNKKIIVMMTDGEPSSDIFNEKEQIKGIKELIKECDRKDITIIHLALTDEASKTPYKNKVQWDPTLGYVGLIDGFTKMLKKVIK